MNTNDRLLHERRKQLEQWLWSLLAHSQIAQSRFMRLFLQLNLAATRATTAGSLALSPEDEEQLETCSEISAAPSSITALSNALTDGVGASRTSPKDVTSELYRMGLRVDQRRDLKRLMKVISSSIEQVHLEAQDIRNENRTLLKDNQSLEDEINSLKQMISEGKSFQDERQEELNKTIEAKEEALKKQLLNVTRLEMSLKDSTRYIESLEGDLRTVKEESNTKTEQQEAEKASLESKLQNQLTMYSKLNQEFLESKEKTREDHLVLAKEVKNLRHEKKSLQEKLKEQEQTLMELTSTQGKLEILESEKQDLLRRIEQMEMKFDDQKIAFDAQLKLQTEELQTQMKINQANSQTLHSQEVESLKNIITNLEESSIVDPTSGVKLVINIESGDDLDGLRRENQELKENDELLCVELEELSGLKTAMKQVLTENKELKDQLDSKVLDSLPNGSTSIDELSQFSDLVDGLYQELATCYNSTRNLDPRSMPIDAKEANLVIEQVADSNGRLQLLKAKVEEMKPTFSHLPMPLINSVSQLFSISIQKCLEINEMKMDAFLTRDLLTQGAEFEAKNPNSRQNENVSEASSVKSLFGGIGAKMSQSSQGFMSFMQRGGGTSQSTPPSEQQKQQSHHEETA